MSDFRTMLAQLRRPRLLIAAARHGQSDYRRERDLRRLTGCTSAELALSRLWTEEEQMEDARLAGNLGYSLSRHVDLLIALTAEVRLQRQEAEDRAEPALAAAEA